MAANTQHDFYAGRQNKRQEEDLFGFSWDSTHYGFVKLEYRQTASHRLFLFALTNETNHPVSPHRVCMYVSVNRVNGRQSSLSGCYDPPCTLKKGQSGALFKKKKGHNPLCKIKTLW